MVSLVSWNVIKGGGEYFRIHSFVVKAFFKRSLKHPASQSVQTENKTIRFWHENLSAMGAFGRSPISALVIDDHIHGGLRIEIGGRLVPWLGYFGVDDVCFGQWLEELALVARAFMTSDNGVHTFDEGEQGQPAFLFERDGERAFFSIVASKIGGGEGDPAWQRIEFSLQEFLEEHDLFRESFFAAIRFAAPDAGETWIHNHVKDLS